MLNTVVFICPLFMSNYVQSFNQMAAILISLLHQWDQIFIFGFLCLINPDSHRIGTLEPFINEKMEYYTAYASHLGFLSPA